MICIKNLEKTFHSAAGDITALKDINLTIEDGDIFGIIGLSGAGKSTLVRCINLLERPTDGEVIVDGKNLMALSRKELLETRRNIGMIFQGFNLLEQRNVLANVCFPLEIAGWKREEAEKRAKELLTMVGLGNRENAYPSQLSGGQKQRVAIARALATRPKYLLCDEATSALDPTTTRSILDLLQEINRTLGVTIIIITHEMKVIDRICNRVAVIDQSHIAEMGKVSEVFANPKSRIARELIVPPSAGTSISEEGKKIRLVFDGDDASRPIISGLILECQIPVNILFADTKVLEGKAYGQMIIQIPDDLRMYEKVIVYLDAHNVSHKEEVPTL